MARKIAFAGFDYSEVDWESDGSIKLIDIRIVCVKDLQTLTIPNIIISYLSVLTNLVYVGKDFETSTTQPSNPVITLTVVLRLCNITNTN